MRAPRFIEVARRPRWIGALLFALLVAGVFAALGQWQIDRAVQQGQADERDTETPVALASVAEPQSPLTSEAGGRMVEVDVTIDPDSAIAIAGRQEDGESGAWLTARAIDDRGASLAVALGWAPTREEAVAAAADIDPSTVTIVGRYLPSESPTVADFEQDTTEAMSVGDLINRWPGFSGDVYAGYVVIDGAIGDLDHITSLPPEQQTELNWLNVFYAVEWVAFMVFALYLWFRLVQDARERETEALEDAEAEGADPEVAATGASGGDAAAR